MSYVQRIGVIVIALTLTGVAPAGEKAAPRVVRIGAVAYAPSAVTVFDNLRRHFAKTDVPIDYVLYSNYDALVDALKNGQVDIAWNTPLAHARYHLLCAGQSQTLVMRDVDCDFRCTLLVRTDSGIKAPSGLQGKTLALGSREAAEATVLPLHYLKKEGVRLGEVRFLRLDEELDLRGNPCSSPLHVLKALRAGRADAGIVGERLWNDLLARKAPEADGLQAVWTSPAFSHCVFTAAKNFDKTIAARFTKVMLAMDGKDECSAEILRLEAARKWVAGSPDGFETLIEALRAQQNDEAKAREQEIRGLVAFVKNKGFYALRDPREKKAIEALRNHGEDAAPALAAMLADGLKNRSAGWIEVYRPLYILKGMGPAAKVALPDIIKALEDAHPINVTAAAEVLADIGPAAKEALPALRAALKRAAPSPKASVKALNAAVEKVEGKGGGK